MSENLKVLEKMKLIRDLDERYRKHDRMKEKRKKKKIQKDKIIKDERSLDEEYEIIENMIFV